MTTFVAWQTGVEVRMKEFTIKSRGTDVSLEEQYAQMYGQFCFLRYLPNHKRCAVYDMKPEYGKGTIQIYSLQNDVKLRLYDLTFIQDFTISFELEQDYFEIEYCLDGCMLIQEEDAGCALFSSNHLSLSLSRQMRGTIKYCAGEKYQGVSISANKQMPHSYFGSSGVDIWNDTIEQLGEHSRTEYYLGQNAFPEIVNIFSQIYHCRLPVESRTLFYESKIMELLSQMVSGELTQKENIQLIYLSPYEIQRIKEIPKLFLEQPFELPTLKTLSDTLSISQKKLTKGFKLVYGDTIYSYCRKLFLKQAASMLLETEQSINDIAYDCGYSTPSNFCAAFKKQYGVTPLKYREASSLRNMG